MSEREKKLNELREDVVDQEEDRVELEISDEIPGNEIDPEVAPGVDVAEELEEEWEVQETEREVSESDAEVSEGMNIEKEEDKGEEPYPEIEEELNKEDTTDSEEED